MNDPLTDSQALTPLSLGVAKWWLPDAVVFVESLPHTATGKLLKLDLRTRYENYLLENVPA